MNNYSQLIEIFKLVGKNVSFLEKYNVANGFPNFKNCLHTLGNTVIESCLRVHPSERPTVAQLLEQAEEQL